MIEYVLMTAFALGPSAPGNAAAEAPAAQAPSKQGQTKSSPGTGAAAGGADAGTSATPGKSVSPSEFKNPVDIVADRFEIQGRTQEATWMGNVRAVRGKTILTCDRLVARYHARTGDVVRIECLGHVEATHKDMWASGERADFDNVNGILVVTGSPKARSGKTFMEGSKVTFNVTRDTISVDDARIVTESSATKLLPKGGGKK